MNSIDRIRTKIEGIEKLLTEVKIELEVMSKETKPHQQKSTKNEPLPSMEDLRSEHEKLYEEFLARNFKAIEEFIKGKSKYYLKAFCKANNLPLDTTKVSKDGIAKEIIQWMAQRKAITKKAI
jgi:hypothetical protein